MAPHSDTSPNSPKNIADDYRLLVVDNNLALGCITTGVLDRSNLGYNLACNGEEAIQFCMDSTYDLILLETHMPDMTGEIIAQKIRGIGGNYASVPIIATSIDLSEKEQEALAASGITNFLRKPVNEVNLLNLISSKLGIPFNKTVLFPPKDDAIYALLEEDEMSLLNWNTLRDYSDLMKADYIPMLKNFMYLAPNLIGDIGEAVIDGDAQRILPLAHQLKSTSVIFGAEDLSNTAAQLEIMARGNDLEFASQYYKELHIIFERIKPVLEKKLVQMHSNRAG